MADDLIAEIARRYGFRERRPSEPGPAYRAELIRHVADRDAAAAHELRVGKRQADWSPADVELFSAIMQRPRDPRAHDPNVAFACMAVEDPGPYTVSDDNLMMFARNALDFAVRFRREEAAKDFAIMASVLLATGQLLHTLPARGDRIRVLKWLAQTRPVYGFWIVADVFVHGIREHPVTHVKTADKSDAFIAHVGSRSLRRTLTQRYRVDAGVAIFEPRIDMGRETFHDDPYAEILVSVPAPDGRPS